MLHLGIILLKDNGYAGIEYDVPVPTFAFDKLMANIGSMSNQGVELGISVVPIQRKDMEMNINFNMSYEE